MSDSTPTRILLGAFEMMNPNNGMPTWTDPRGRGDDWDRLDYWVDLARMLDAAGFDFLFFADTYGYATLDGVMPREVAQHGIQFPALDPMLAIAALAHATRQLGFVVTSPTTVEKPYGTARRFATLDRLTGGRIGWNVVTGSSQATTDELFGVTQKSVTTSGTTQQTSSSTPACASGSTPGTRMPSVATALPGCMPTRACCTAWRSTVPISGGGSSRCLRHRSARPCCSRPEHPTADARTPRATPRRSSSRGSRSDRRRARRRHPRAGRGAGQAARRRQGHHRNDDHRRPHRSGKPRRCGPSTKRCWGWMTRR